MFSGYNYGVANAGTWGERLCWFKTKQHMGSVIKIVESLCVIVSSGKICKLNTCIAGASFLWVRLLKVFPSGSALAFELLQSLYVGI